MKQVVVEKTLCQFRDLFEAIWLFFLEYTPHSKNSRDLFLSRFKGSQKGKRGMSFLKWYYDHIFTHDFLDVSHGIPWKNKNAVYHLYLALINCAVGLHGRVLTGVVSTDRGQEDSPIQTDLVRLLTCLLYDKNKNILIRLMPLVCTNWHFDCEWRWAEFNSSKVCSSSLLFFSSAFWHSQK